MKCPKCGSNNVYVTDSRRDDGKVIRRRRKCADCEYRFTSLEVAVEQLIAVRVGRETIYIVPKKLQQ